MKSMKSIALTNTIWKFGERIIAQAVTLIVSIILARVLSPDDFGIVSIVTVFFNFANVIISGGLNTALIQKKDADKEDYSSVLYVCIGVSLLLFMILWFLSPVIANIYDHQELTLMIRVMGISLPVYAIKSIVCAYVSSTLQFRTFFFATIGGTLVSALIGIVMALNGCGAWSLIAQQVSNTVIDTIILYTIARMPLGKAFSWRKYVSLYRYGWKVFVSSLIDAIYNQSLPLFIGVKYTSADLSYYTKGNVFPGAIASTTNSTLAAVLFPIIAKKQDDKEIVLNYTRMFMRISSYILFPLMLGFFAIADNFVSIVLTDKWLPATIYIRLFCVADMFMMITTGNCETIKAIGRSDVFLKMEIIKKTCYFAIIGLFMLLSNSPVSLAVSTLVCNLVALAVNSFPNRKLIGYTYKLQFTDIIHNLIISVVMMLIVIFIGRIIPGSKVMVMLAQIIIGGISYFFLSVITRNTNYKYIKKSRF